MYKVQYRRSYQSNIGKDKLFKQLKNNINNTNNNNNNLYYLCYYIKKSLLGVHILFPILPIKYFFKIKIIILPSLHFKSLFFTINYFFF